jgi:hypothetical protein
MTDIYHLWSRSKAPAHGSEEWLQDVAPALGRCAGCGQFRADRAIDVSLLEPLDGSALNFCWSTGLGIIRRDLLDALGGELVFKNLRLGHVTDPRGQRLAQFRSFRAVRCVTIRGGRDSTLRRCEVCNHILYAPVRAHHLVGDTASFRGLLGTNLGTLITDESVVAAIDRPKYKNLGLSKIRVSATPLDGRLADLEQALMSVKAS